jgi:hypothetical protein
VEEGTDAMGVREGKIVGDSVDRVTLNAELCGEEGGFLL